VRPFVDGPEALAYIRADEFVGALITSAQLQSMPGIELCRQVRSQSSSRRPMYIVLMSSNNEQSRLIEALQNGADDFMGKPPAVEELYARLRVAERFGSMQRELVRLATTDPLTGMPNRRSFFEAAEEVCTLADAGESLAAIMIVAREVMQSGQIVGRLGGEEFAILLSGCTLADAVRRAEELRQRLAGLAVESGETSLRFTCSFGASEWQLDDTIDELLRRADVALYEAKASGRNRVVAADAALLNKGGNKTTGIVRAAPR
jgi:PleD family two-component response regulator